MRSPTPADADDGRAGPPVARTGRWLLLGVGALLAVAAGAGVATATAPPAPPASATAAVELVDLTGGGASVPSQGVGSSGAVPVATPLLPSYVVADLPRVRAEVDRVVPAGGGPYGVGMLPTVRFDTAIPREARWQVERLLEVRLTPQPLDVPRWGWIDDRTVVLRGRDYWEPGTRIQVKSRWSPDTPVAVFDGRGKDTVRKGPAWRHLTALRLDGRVRVDFVVGRHQVIRIDGATHTARVIRDGVERAVLPTSLGKSGWETTTGVKTLMEFYDYKRLRNTTGPEQWDVPVQWAIRLTWTGEFIHSATWNSAIGSANTSHGCTNLTLADANWLYQRSLPGDVVVTRRSGGAPVALWNNDGAAWNTPWRKWKPTPAP